MKCLTFLADAFIACEYSRPSSSLVARSEKRRLYSQANAFTKQREVIKNHTYLFSFVVDYTVVLELNYIVIVPSGS